MKNLIFIMLSWCYFDLGWPYFDMMMGNVNVQTNTMCCDIMTTLHLCHCNLCLLHYVNIID
jgi:hypothetical protein